MKLEVGAWLRAQSVERRKQGEKGGRKREEREREHTGNTTYKNELGKKKVQTAREKQKE